MENASKALLIAGAILLVIAIIGIGMSIFNQAQDIVGDATAPMDALLVSAHNNRFQAYTKGSDTEIKGSLIISLVGDTAAYNDSLTDSRLQVTIVYNDGTDDISLLVPGSAPTLYTGGKSNIVSKDKYYGVAEFDDSGVITDITFYNYTAD
ncbi:MAG: hypothetical protein PHH22_00360 [Clostridia bacterium]|nr:hypothetical protein [Clostridia bacterium]